jgi:hypothetical protein
MSLTYYSVPQSAGPLRRETPRGLALSLAQVLTDTASRCPVKVYRCQQLWASQMRMSLLQSPEACGDKDDGHRHIPHTQTSHCPQGQPSLTRYLPSEEMAMQRM